MSGLRGPIPVFALFEGFDNAAGVCRPGWRELRAGMMSGMPRVETQSALVPARIVADAPPQTAQRVGPFGTRTRASSEARHAPGAATK